MSATATRPASATRTPVVLVADKLDPEGVAILERAGIEVRVQTGLSPEALVAAAKDVDGILVRSASTVTAEVIAGAPRLRAVGRAGIGVDNIDVAAASLRGVLVMNTPLANATTTAELAIAHIFALARHLPRAQATMAAGEWAKNDLVGREVTGKTLVVVGLGKIGRLVAERGLGLKMKVLGHDPFLTGESPVPGVELVDFETAVSRADFLSIHVPKSQDTMGLFDKHVLARMKPSACLINCARGGIVVEDDLAAALTSGQLAGAALDVFTTEPLPADSPLRKVPNLHLTPHLGASSSEAQQRVSTEVAQQMADYLLRGEARCAVNAPTVPAEALNVLRPYMLLGRRSALMLGQIDDDPIVRVEICYGGELADRDTAPVRLEVIAGLLSPRFDGPVNAVNAEQIATESGLAVLEEHSHESSEFTSLLTLRAVAKSGAVHSVAGTVFRGAPRLVLFEGFGVDFEPAGNLLLTRHSDAPGVLGTVATWLGSKGFNIGGLHMASHRPDGEHALALYELDRPLSVEQIHELDQLAPIQSARSIVM